VLSPSLIASYPMDQLTEKEKSRTDCKCVITVLAIQVHNLQDFSQGESITYLRENKGNWINIGFLFLFS
jgi:hypothetical protein